MVDLTGNPLLSAEAKALDGPTLAAYTRLAESLLGVKGSDYDGLGEDEKVLWTHMLVMQVNYLQTQSDAEAYRHMGLSGHQLTMRQQRAITSPAAQAIRELYFSNGSMIGGFRVGAILTEDEEMDE